MALNNPGHRSLSQSSLQSTYHTHETTSNAPRQRSPSQPRLPFQSLNETSVLLRSPGPLESLLKTTTETGDLGIYSINLPSLGTRHDPPRSKDSPRDEKRQSRSRHDGFKYGATRDDRKLLPSYRDPTSEILSLYGGSQTPYSRSYSPTSEGQRSRSLTTCSSRRVPSYKSSGTLSSQQSNSGHRRPRSPFPYPARLKRPGVRPSSPAVTDNGLIDYRGIDEMDRSAHVSILIFSLPLPTRSNFPFAAHNVRVIHDKRPSQVSPIPPFVSETRVQSFNVFAAYAHIIITLLRIGIRLSRGPGTVVSRISI
ncbi:hypothetical protein FPOAC2_11134 [Fusarium poae]